MNQPKPAKTDRVDFTTPQVRLEPWHRGVLYLTFAVVWISGAIWLVAEALKEPTLGPVHLPLQTLSMKIHGAAMLAFLVALGTLMPHVRLGLTFKANRSTGCCIIAWSVLLVLTGWLLYYSPDDALRHWSSAMHWSIGIAMLPLLYTHIRTGRALRKRI